MSKSSPELRKSVIYSQNFTASPSLVASLIKKSFISKEDIVYEIGPGSGIITTELAKMCKKVIAMEVDKDFVKKLKLKFDNIQNVEIREGNFLSIQLPKLGYKVFSNIPFNITAAIINRLTETENPPLDSFLFVQHDAARKFVGTLKETQSSLLLKSAFELSIVHRFKRTDFRPVPNVDIVLLRIKKRMQSIVEIKNKQLYRDFIIYSFNAWKPTLREGLKKIFTDRQFLLLSKSLEFSISAKPTDLNFSQWLELFNFSIKGTDISKKSLILGSENRLKSQQAKLDKIHRTRVAKDWKN